MRIYVTTAKYWGFTLDFKDEERLMTPFVNINCMGLAFVLGATPKLVFKKTRLRRSELRTLKELFVEQHGFLVISLPNPVKPV